MNTPRVAFKEWAAICRALGEGRQAVILRKGGIAEDGGEFRVEHERFWLYPTFVHQQEQGTAEEYGPLLQEAKRERPPEDRVRLTWIAEVTAVHRAAALEGALSLAGLHGWSEETVRTRFHYREPGLFVLVVRVWRTEGVEIAERPEYAGCKSWVPLAEEVAAARMEAVMGEDALDRIAAEVGRRLTVPEREGEGNRQGL